MGGLAMIARERGHTVTGCDAHVYPPMSDQLRDLGIRLHEGYDAQQLGAGALGEQARERRLADADRPFDRDVAKAR